MTDVNGQTNRVKAALSPSSPPIRVRFEEPMNFPFPEEFGEFSHQKAFTRCFISDVAIVLAGISSRLTFQ